MASMNRLTRDERAKIIHLLCEGMSIRAVTRLTGISKTTVTKLAVDAAGEDMINVLEAWESA
jgi:transposase